eukprot:gene2487-2830_t
MSPRLNIDQQPKISSPFKTYYKYSENSADRKVLKPVWMSAELSAGDIGDPLAGLYRPIDSKTFREIPIEMVTKRQHELILYFYQFLKDLVPETHTSKRYNIQQGKRYFYGFELVEWILESKHRTITRKTAVELAECSLKLHIFIKAKVYHEKQVKDLSDKRKHKTKMIFRDDSTKFSFTPSEIIEDYQHYNTLLKTRFYKYGYYPNATSLINRLFADIGRLAGPPTLENKPTKPIHKMIDKVFHFSNQEKLLSVESPRRVDTHTQTHRGKPVVIEMNQLVSMENGDLVELDISHHNDHPTLVTDAYHVVSLDLTGLEWTRFVPLLVIAATLYVVAFGLTVFSMVKHREKMEDLRDTIKVTFLSTVSMSLFQLGDLSSTHFMNMANALNWMGFAVQVCAFVLLYIQLIIRVRRKLPIRMTPSFFFNGTGFIVGAVAMLHANHRTMAWIMWGFGSLYSGIVEISTLTNYAVFGLLQPEHIPSQTILLAFPSLAFSGLVQLTTQLGIARAFYLLIFINLIIVVILWTMMSRKFRRERFMFHLGFWAFCFPLISFASASVTYYKYTPTVACKVIAIFIVLIANMMFLTVATITTVLALRRNLFIPSRFAIPV